MTPMRNSSSAGLHMNFTQTYKAVNDPSTHVAELKSHTLVIKKTIYKMTVVIPLLLRAVTVVGINYFL